MENNNQGEWWPDHIRHVFVAIGGVMRSDRLYPDDLLKLSADVGAILPGHSVIVEHLSGKALGGRKGRYVITIEGAAFAGRWSFGSGQLEERVSSALGSLHKF